MNSKPTASLERAADFIWRNARLLERALFARLFLDGPADAVLAALRAYRNPDGGFGNALEPDVRAPISTPLACEVALLILREAAIVDRSLARELCDYLASVAEASGRVPIVTREITDFPRSPHWQEPLFTGDSLNPSAGIAGLLLYQRIEHPWLTRAVEWCWRRIERPLEDAHEVATALRFLQHAPDRARAEATALRVAREADRAKWFLKQADLSSYGVTPLTLCPRPDSIARAAFSQDLIDAHLDALAAIEQSDGGWPIRWDTAGPGATMEWRGYVTLEALTRLRAWGRI
jgi:hypothetical protein